jgi:hypothetical protein
LPSTLGDPPVAAKRAAEPVGCKIGIIYQWRSLAPSVVTSSDLAVECRTDTLLIVVEASPIAVTGNHASTAFDVLLESVTLAVGDRSHACDSVMKSCPKADAALPYSLPANYA